MVTHSEPLTPQHLAATVAARTTIRIAAAVVLGLIGLWYLAVYGDRVAISSEIKMTRRMLLNENYPIAELQKARETVGANPETSMRARTAALLTLRILEESTRDNAEALPGIVADAERDVMSALRSSPTQGFFWFALFLIRSEYQHQQLSDVIPLLRQSYTFAPFEGWISLRRVHAVIPIVNQMPLDIQTAAKAEFFTLIDQGIVDGVVDTYWLAPRDVRREVLAHIAELPKLARDRMTEHIALSPFTTEP